MPTPAATFLTPSKPKTYDQKCFDLALAFVRDEVAEKNIHPDRVPELADKLAQEIQQAIEDFLAFEVQS